MRKTLGGDRIGSGAKMDVELSGYARSTHSLTTDIATTMSIGTLIPIHHSLILAGDTREIDVDALLLTHPTEGPLFGSFKLQIDVFKADMRLYIAKLHMNLLETGMDMTDIKLPLIEMYAEKIDWDKDPNNQQINPSSIFKYLHISGLGDTIDASAPFRQFNAIPWLMYWDVYKNYYANKQEKKGAVIHTGTSLDIVATITDIQILYPPDTTPNDLNGGGVWPAIGSEMYINYEGATPILEQVIIYTGNFPTTWVLASELYENIDYSNPDQIKLSGLFTEHNGKNLYGSGYISGTDPITSEPRVTMFDLSKLDDIKMDILADIKSTSAFKLNTTSPEPFGLALQTGTGTYAKLFSQEGLAVKTYQSDLFNNWLNTEYIDGVNGVNARSAIQTDVDGKFTIDNFLIKQKMYDYLNRIAVAGATVDDMMEVTYDVKNKTRSEIPTFEGGASKELIFEQVISNSATAEQPLGTIAGRGKTAGHKGGKIRITNDDTQHAYYMVIASLTPRIKYTQGNGWGVNLKTYEDLHKPAFDQIGFQDLITDQMASWDTKTTNTGVLTLKSAGKQPAWINYQTEIDRAFGNFAIQNSEGWMILDRNYDWNETTKSIKDLTTYIDPAKYNGVFAYKSLDAQNIWAQFKIEDKAIRTMSANQIPKM